MVQRCEIRNRPEICHRIDSPPSAWRMLDPSCGDGSFVLAVLAELAATDHDRLSLIRDCVFGVDVDPIAIESLKKRVSEWVSSDDDRTDELNRVLDTNFLCGDALLGEDWLAFNEDSLNQHGRLANVASFPPAIQWASAFPSVAQEGGFDLVIGNPPYLRELNAKSVFDRIAGSSLGRKWRRARMDLWHYFLHRGLDLLKPRGTLCYIVNSYWIGSRSAIPLVERLAAEATTHEIIWLGSAKIFPSVAGRHMILRATKGGDRGVPCRIVDLTHVARERLKVELCRSHISTKEEMRSLSESLSPKDVPSHASEIAFLAGLRIVSQDDLWREGRLNSTTGGASEIVRDDGSRLSQGFEVRQGIAENPPFVTNTVAKEMNDLSLAGGGVFVLTEAEVQSLTLSDHERSLLRPYYSLSSFDRFFMTETLGHSLLYLTKQTAPSLRELPHIENHLQRFRAVLERRREVRRGAIAWWHLHWPREERLFIEPRILSIQMGAIPRFVYSERPSFVGFSMHVIVHKKSLLAVSEAHVSGLTLPALSALLNSSHARVWFENHAKYRGRNLDISGTVLKQFPLPKSPRPDLGLVLDRLARDWHRQEDAGTIDLEHQLDQLVEEWYRDALPQDDS